MNRIDVVDNEELLLRCEVTNRSISGHSKKLRVGRCFKDVKNQLSTKKYRGME